MTAPSPIGGPPPPNDPHTDETRPVAVPDPEVSEPEPEQPQPSPEELP